MTLHILAAGASKGLVLHLQSQFTQETGLTIDGFFNAVGAVKEKFLNGEACDVLILTATQIAELTAQGLLVAGSAAPLGAVSTGVAVPAGQPIPDISSPAHLAAALLASQAVFVPDPYQSTAGIHFMKILDKLGIQTAVLPHLKAFPNGAIAMRHLADSTEAHAIGSTQITEIKYTSGLTLVGSLPPEFALSTVYSAAISAKATNQAAARHLVALLTGTSTRTLRHDSGFEALPGE
ncbi:MAG: substrate-binding domain-containing protein [Acidocella sp.]|nr:substrate-binding domain-containing protein [Acidocella sp.]